ncbi:MAG: hypothetical protein ACYCVW_16565 [Rhodocyclaceae bacterium]
MDVIRDIATINNNEDGKPRVTLTLCSKDGRYFIYTSTGEDCGLGGFASVDNALAAVWRCWGTEVWGLRFLQGEEDA